MRYRVTCTTKHEKHELITHLGCYTTTNLYIYLTEAEVIDRIENQGDTFYVERPTGHVTDVEVATREGKKYLKTKADSEKPDNLLSLRDCPQKKQDGSGVVRNGGPEHSTPGTSAANGGTSYFRVSPIHRYLSPGRKWGHSRVERVYSSVLR
jgi:hypothetical protein